MDSLTLIIGFALMAGLAAGYATARFAPVWAVWTLGLVCLAALILGAGVIAITASAGLMLWSGIAIMPFAAAVLLAGAIGLIVRSQVARP
ncbi:hypothetical protein V8J82_18815 [Gymnodinialimonas sp. 2305UL16-5]|uniref:hypothetical protein n=1 Tax=Gymnodinialimonas mytili TaxID=3126503 RepID=UPI0030A54F8B